VSVFIRLKSQISLKALRTNVGNKVSAMRVTQNLITGKGIFTAKKGGKSQQNVEYIFFVNK
jgi:hypothetical protein